MSADEEMELEKLGAINKNHPASKPLPVPPPGGSDSSSEEEEYDDILLDPSKLNLKWNYDVQTIWIVLSNIILCHNWLTGSP